MKIFTGIIAGITALASLSGCSTPSAPLPPPTSAFQPPPAEARHVVSPEASSKLVRRIEKKLRHSKGPQVLVSKKLLRELIEQEKISETKQARLNDELEALKRVDREETTKAAP